MKYGFIVCTVLGMLVLAGTSQAKYLGDIQFSYGTPSHLAFNQHVDVTIDYNVTEVGGVRIFVIPLTAGSLTPNSAMSGLALIPAGSGTVSRYFTVLSGDFMVDQARVYMTNADQSVVLLDLYLDVQYHFADHGIYNIQIDQDKWEYMAFSEDIAISFDYNTNEPGGVYIFARPVTEGMLTPH